MARKPLFELIFIFVLLLLPLTSAFAEGPEKAKPTQQTQEQNNIAIDPVIGITAMGGVGALIVAYNNNRRKKNKNRPKKTIKEDQYQ